MKTLILFLIKITLIFITIQSNAENLCGATTPKFCVREKVIIDGYPGAIITGVLSNGDYTVTGAYYSKYRADKLGKTKGCGTTTPKFCVGENVIIDGYPNSKVIGVDLTTNDYYISGAYSNKYSADKLGKTKGCGTTTPKFCIGENVDIDGYPNSKVIGVNLTTNDYYISGAYSNKYSADKLVKVRSSNSNSIDSLSVYMSTDTQDIVQTYQALASVTTKDRSDFLTATSAYLTQLNSEDVNIMAGMVIAKIIRLSTSQAVKENFEKPALEFTASIEKNGWKSIDQIEANLRTLDFATRVIFAAVKLKLSLANNLSNNNADLAELGRIAATPQLSRKIVDLQSFCESHRSLFDELIQDPRHGVLGMVATDVVGWVLSK